MADTTTDATNDATATTTIPEGEEDIEKFDAESIPQKEQLFSDIGPENSFTELESLCMNCEEQGITRLLLTKVPFFKEIILMAFHCPHCGWRSNEVQSGGSIAERGVKIELKVEKEDLNRQVVKSDSASLTIPELDFEIPAITQRGQLNTVEGFLMQSLDALRAGQEERRTIDPETTAQIDKFLVRLEGLSKGEEPFTLVLNDPAGNSFIENPEAPRDDPRGKTTHYKRTPEQNAAIGLTSDETAPEQALKTGASGNSSYELDFDSFDSTTQVMTFPGNCSNCNTPSDTRMLAVEIPFFKQVIIMATNCDACGFKSSEVKAGGAISEQGRRLSLSVETPQDLNRNILKSETATVTIPELGFEVTRGTLGGRFTTVEGLLDGIKTDLQSVNPFISGDSSSVEDQAKYKIFVRGLEELIAGKKFTLLLDDPVANSYIENPNAPDPDPQLTSETYERSWQQNEDLGINDMKTEGYNPEAERAAAAEAEAAKGKSET